MSLGTERASPLDSLAPPPLPPTPLPPLLAPCRPLPPPRGCRVSLALVSTYFAAISKSDFSVYWSSRADMTTEFTLPFTKGSDRWQHALDFCRRLEAADVTIPNLRLSFPACEPTNAFMQQVACTFARTVRSLVIDVTPHPALFRDGGREWVEFKDFMWFGPVWLPQLQHLTSLDVSHYNFAFGR